MPNLEVRARHFQRPAGRRLDGPHRLCPQGGAGGLSRPVGPPGWPAARRIVVDSARADYTALGGLPPDEFYADSFTTEADKHKETA